MKPAEPRRCACSCGCRHAIVPTEGEAEELLCFECRHGIDVDRQDEEPACQS